MIEQLFDHRHWSQLYPPCCCSTVWFDCWCLTIARSAIRPWFSPTMGQNASLLALAFPTRGQVASQWLLDSTGDQTELFSNSAVVENLICSSNPSWCIPCKGPAGACVAAGIAAVAPMPAAVVHHLHSAAMLLLTWVALTTIYSFLSHFSSFLYPFPVFLNLVGQGMYQ